MWPFPDHGLRDRLHRVAVPTLVLWGRDDNLIPAVYADDFKQEIAGCTAQVYDDCGHLLQMEQQEKALADVRGLLS